MISIVTPTYNTSAEVLQRSWESIQSQSYVDWEWVVWDDSEDMQTWELLKEFSDPRVYVFRSLHHSGSIGQVKRRAFMIAQGDILVELDHDDELLPGALDAIQEAFEDPEIGFVYSDCCEIHPDGRSHTYPDGWAWGFGYHYWVPEYNCWSIAAPPVNPVTVRNITSSPNHVRCWRASVYRELNGHDPRYTVADDYELYVRTFLHTKMKHVRKMLYRQHIDPNSAQRVRNALIHANVAEIAARYSDAIDKRFTELA